MREVPLYRHGTADTALVRRVIPHIDSDLQLWGLSLQEFSGTQGFNNLNEI